MLYLRDNWSEIEGEMDFSTLPRVASPTMAAPGTTRFACSGLSPDAMIQTESGPVMAKALVPGDMVLTHDNGMQPLLWCGRSRDTATKDAPMRLHGGQGSMLLASGHLVLVKHAKAELLFGVDEVLCHVRDLGHLPGISPAPRSAPGWVHLLFGAHEMIAANDAWVESLSPDMRMISQTHPDMADDIIECVPRLRYAQGRAAYVVTRAVLDRREAQLLD